VDQNWQRIIFQKDFVNPIAVANAPTLNENDPAVIRIQNANSQSFEICLQEWQYLDGAHSSETVSYIVMEKGRY
jgi:hypothetical protein